MSANALFTECAICKELHLLPPGTTGVSEGQSGIAKGER
jgi:hypothetical protein